MKCAIAEIFGPTIQGEGLLTGVPSVFVRTNGCNLSCAFKNSLCDTAYTSINPEPPKYTETNKVIEELKKIFDAHPNLSALVITGGEPMLQQKAVLEIINELREYYDETRDIHVTIETNGSIKPSIDLLNSVSLWSMSPKLANSEYFTDNIPLARQEAHKKARFNPEAICTIMKYGIETQIKFVYDGSDESIKNWWTKLHEDPNMDADCYPVHYLLMPAGRTIEELGQTAPATVEAAIRMGYRYCDRTHIRIWGDRREV